MAGNLSCCRQFGYDEAEWKRGKLDVKPKHQLNRQACHSRGPLQADCGLPCCSLSDDPTSFCWTSIPTIDSHKSVSATCLQQQSQPAVHMMRLRPKHNQEAATQLSLSCDVQNGSGRPGQHLVTRHQTVPPSIAKPSDSKLQIRFQAISEIPTSMYMPRKSCWCIYCISSTSEC